MEIKTVVRPKDKDDKFTVKDEAYSGSGVLINSEFLNNLKVPEDSITKTIEILEREKRIDLYKDCLKFLKTRVELDLALFKDDIWSH